MADYAKAAARHVGLDPIECTLVLNGGVFRHPSDMQRVAVMQALGRRATGNQRPAASHEPAVGAVLLALEVHGVVVDAAVMLAIEESLPPAEVYAS
ncbi:MAG TPA: hypothetical protein VFN03_12765 [Trueperaceae bacterium]|nr:hypothetical protein [Trueperaceae bacterium]